MIFSTLWVLDRYLRDCSCPSGKSWTTLLDQTFSPNKNNSGLTRGVESQWYIWMFMFTYVVQFLVNNTFKSWKHHLLKGKKMLTSRCDHRVIVCDILVQTSAQQQECNSWSTVTGRQAWQAVNISITHAWKWPIVFLPHCQSKRGQSKGFIYLSYMFLHQKSLQE